VRERKKVIIFNWMAKWEFWNFSGYKESSWRWRENPWI